MNILFCLLRDTTVKPNYQTFTDIYELKYFPLQWVIWPINIRIKKKKTVFFQNNSIVCTQHCLEGRRGEGEINLLLVVPQYFILWNSSSPTQPSIYSLAR